MKRPRHAFRNDYVSKADRKKADLFEEVLAAELRNTLAMFVVLAMVVMVFAGFWLITP